MIEIPRMKSNETSDSQLIPEIERMQKELKKVLAYYLGDETFPPGASFLFDSNVEHYMPTDGIAAIGSYLVDIIVKNS